MEFKEFGNPNGKTLVLLPGTHVNGSLILNMYWMI